METEREQRKKRLQDELAQKQREKQSRLRLTPPYLDGYTASFGCCLYGSAALIWMSNKIERDRKFIQMLATS